MPERIARIGAPTALTCLVSEPQGEFSAAPGVILLNSGVMHHIGTCRMSVRICRAFANAGYLAARFDLSGLGDSESRSGTEPFALVAQREVSEVMDFLQQNYDITRFVLIGLCSGADAAYETALKDDRVVGICQLDAYVYRNLRYYIHYYLPRVIKLDVWRRFLKRTFFPEKNGVDLIDEEFIELPSYIRIFPPRAEIEAGLTRLVNRGVELYNIFTGGQDDVVIYPDQYSDNFKSVPFKDQLKLDLYADCSHIVMEPVYQQKIVADMLIWFEQRCQKVTTDRITND